MRTLLLVLLFLAACREKSAPNVAPAPAAVAAPETPGARRPPRLPTSQTLLAFAQSADTAEAWTAVADSYQREVATCTGDCRELAYEVVLSRKQAVTAAAVAIDPPDIDAELTAPVAMPPEVAAMVASLEAYLALLDPTDDEVAPMQFLMASASWKWRQSDAVERLETVLRDHRDDPTAEYAANQLLHLLARDKRFTELRAWVAELSADETFLADKPELRATLQTLIASL